MGSNSSGNTALPAWARAGSKPRTWYDKSVTTLDVLRIAAPETCAVPGSAQSEDHGSDRPSLSPSMASSISTAVTAAAAGSGPGGLPSSGPASGAPGYISSSLPGRVSTPGLATAGGMSPQGQVMQQQGRLSAPGTGGIGTGFVGAGGAAVAAQSAHQVMVPIGTFGTGGGGIGAGSAELTGDAKPRLKSQVMIFRGLRVRMGMASGKVLNGLLLNTACLL